VVKQSFQARRQFGVVPEESNVYRELSGLANLRFAGRLHRLPRAERERRAQELLERFELAERRNARVETYSRGMRRKLTIAMALMHRPSILFLDEPTAGLDVQGQRSIIELVNELRDEGITIFLTTHQIEEADQLCDRVAIINRGRIAAIDTPERLRQMMQAVRTVELTLEREPSSALATLRELPGVTSVVKMGDRYRIAGAHVGELVSQVSAWAEKQRVTIVSLNTPEPSLEDVFVLLTGQQGPSVEATSAGATEPTPVRAGEPRQPRRRGCGGGAR